MFTVTVSRADVASDEASEAMSKGPRPRYHVPPGQQDGYPGCSGRSTGTAEPAGDRARGPVGARPAHAGAGHRLDTGRVALIVLASHQRHGIAVTLTLLAVLIFAASALALAGLTSVVPGQARVVQLFGRYRGTIRDSGLQWVNPFTRRIKVSTRIRNQESAQAKVNDADGNPIEIAAVVIWQVRDAPLLGTDEHRRGARARQRQGRRRQGQPAPAVRCHLRRRGRGRGPQHARLLLMIGHHFMAADHGNRSHADVLELAARWLLA
jgi:SPFH domain / Band 7 family